MSETTADTPLDVGKSTAPERMCVICRERRPKAALERFVREVERVPGEPGAPEAPTAHCASGLVHDIKKNLPGRGYYVCGRERCRERFRHFRVGTRKSRG